MTTPEAHHPDTLQHLRRCVLALDSKKAEALRILDVSQTSSITNFFIIATGTSEPHLRALLREIERLAKEDGLPLVGSENTPETGWVVIDAFDFMIHIFLPKTRAAYALEKLWLDAHEIDANTLLSA